MITAETACLGVGGRGLKLCILTSGGILFMFKNEFAKKSCKIELTRQIFEVR
jgi:hypothetical protein